MKQEIKNKLPQWIFEDKYYNLCLSNDIDSLMSCYILNLIKGWNISTFYSFNHIASVNGAKKGQLVGVDLDLCHQEKCVGNHCNLISSLDIKNPNCVNLNNLENISRNNYTQKYAGSCILQIMSILDIDLKTFTDEQLEVLLSIDTSFKSYYFNNKTASNYIANILGYDRLIDILKKHDNDYFYNIIKKYKLNGSIRMNKDGYLTTDIELDKISLLFSFDIHLPQEKFYIDAEFKQYTKNLTNEKTKDDIVDKIFSLALTYKNAVKYSVCSKRY